MYEVRHITFMQSFVKIDQLVQKLEGEIIQKRADSLVTSQACVFFYYKRKIV
jgi:hypothetical protein